MWGYESDICGKPMGEIMIPWNIWVVLFGFNGLGLLGLRYSIIGKRNKKKNPKSSLEEEEEENLEKRE